MIQNRSKVDCSIKQNKKTLKWQKQGWVKMVKSICMDYLIISLIWPVLQEHKHIQYVGSRGDANADVEVFAHALNPK